MHKAGVQFDASGPEIRLECATEVASIVKSQDTSLVPATRRIDVGMVNDVPGLL